MGSYRYKDITPPFISPIYLPETKNIIYGKSKFQKQLLNKFYEGKRLAKDGRYTEAYRCMEVIADMNPVSGIKFRTYYEEIEKEDALKVILDVDNLKWLNDKAVGHEGADQALVMIGRVLCEVFVFVKAQVYHPHGDEMTVIVDMRNKDERTKRNLVRQTIRLARIAAEKIAQNVIVNPNDQNKAAVPTATLGVSFSKELGEEIVREEKKKRRTKWFYQPSFVHVGTDVQEFINEETDYCVEIQELINKTDSLFKNLH